MTALWYWFDRENRMIGSMNTKKCGECEWLHTHGDVQPDIAGRNIQKWVQTSVKVK